MPQFSPQPDLVSRFATNAPLNEEIKWEAIYASRPEGYVDYPGVTAQDLVRSH